MHRCPCGQGLAAYCPPSFVLRQKLFSTSVWPAVASWLWSSVLREMRGKRARRQFRDHLGGLGFRVTGPAVSRKEATRGIAQPAKPQTFIPFPHMLDVPQAMSSTHVRRGMFEASSLDNHRAVFVHQVCACRSTRSRLRAAAGQCCCSVGNSVHSDRLETRCSVSSLRWAHPTVSVAHPSAHRMVMPDFGG